MNTASDIEHAIEGLPAEEYTRLLAWIDERRTAEVDAEFEASVLAGKFDLLADRASREIEAGQIVALEDFLRAES